MAEGLPYPHMDWTCSNLPDSFEKFERHCRLMFDGPLKGKSKKELCAYVLLWIGDKGRTIHASWDLTDEENRDPNSIFKRFRDFVQPKSNPVFSRYKFYHETQGNDSIEEFVARLTIAARDCDFGDSTDEMIRDRIVFGCRSDRVREKLIEKGRDLTLDLAKQISQAHEYNRQQMETMKESRDVDWVSNRNGRQRGHRNHGARRTHPEGRSKKDNPPSCTRCGRKPHSDRTDCPALGKQCDKCGKKNHFSKMCRTNINNNQNVHVINEDLSYASSTEEDFYVHTVQELDTIFQEMQTLKQQEVGLKLLTSLLKRNETRLGGRFKMKTVIWYNMNDFEKFFDICSGILLTSDEGQDLNVSDDFNNCLCQFSISDDDILRYMEEIMVKLAFQFDSIETSLDYNEENSLLASENDSNDCTMGIDINGEVHESVGESLTDKPDSEDLKEKDNKSITEELTKNIKNIDSYNSSSNDFIGTKDENCAKKNFSNGVLVEHINNSYQRANTDTLLEKHPFRDIDLEVNSTEPESDSIHFKQTSVSSINTNDKEAVLSSTLCANGICEGDVFLEKKCIDEEKQVYVPFIDVLSSLKSEAKACKHDRTSLKTCRNLKEELQRKDKSNDNSKQDVYFTRLSKRKVKLKPEQKRVSVKEKNIIEYSESNCHEFDPKSVSKDGIIENMTTKRDENKDLQKTGPNVRSYSCSVCSRTFCRRKILYRHYRKHEGGEFCCLLCGAFHENHTQLIDHMTTHKNVCRFFCPKCGEVFNKPLQYRKHVASHRIHTCTVCRDIFANRVALVQHKNISHRNTNITQRDIPPAVVFTHQCDVCGARFTKEAPYFVHRAKHTGEKPYKCDLCRLTFTNHQCYIKHTMTIKHNVKLGKTDGERKYLCQQCGKAYLRKDALKRHEKHHTGEKRHMCQFCGYKCQEGNNLKRHIALHFESQRNFICEICGAAFHTKKTLEVHHQFKHSNERNYPCTHCKMAFKARSSLIRHMKVHSQNKEHSCWCGTAFKTLYNLRRHINKLHGGDSKLPPVKHVQTLDCAVKNSVSKTDFQTKPENQSVVNRGENSQQLEKLDEEIHHDSIQNISVEEDSGIKYLSEVSDVAVIPTINSFSHSETLQQESYSMEQYAEQKEVAIPESVSIGNDIISKNAGAYSNENLESATQNSAVEKENLPQFSLYGYPPPYSNAVPQFMYMQPRYETGIHSQPSYASYEQLVRFGSVFSAPSVQQSPVVNPSLNLPVTRMIETESYGIPASSLSQDQLRSLHHEIYNRLTQEEISQRLSSEAYRQINTSDQKQTDMPSTLQFDYSEKSDCSFEQPTVNKFDYSEKSDCSFKQSAVDKLTESGVKPKVAGTTHEDMYESSIDADYLQSRREMAAESLALMSALTPESVYNGHDIHNQLL